MTPSEQQYQALAAISEWYRNGSKPYFYLGGPAGSGKTTVGRMAVEKCGLDPDNHRQVKYASFMGKAALVMSRKGMKAQTIHQLIYTLLEKDNGELVFGLNKDSELTHARLLLLDECSMISDSIATDLLSFGVKILVLGDPEQLDPVKGTGYFTKHTPDFQLTEIHRQALDNPIIRLSQDILKDIPIPMGVNGAVKCIPFEEISPDELLNGDQVLTGMHKTRHELNRLMLELDGFGIEYPYQVGVKVICRRNYFKNGMVNGLIGYTTETVTPYDYDEAGRWFNQSVYFEEGLKDHPYIIDKLKMNMGAFQDNWKPRNDLEKTHDDRLIDASREFAYQSGDDSQIQRIFDFAYAITGHSSQGSQWDNVILFDDGMMSWKKEARRKWLYTTVTRAAETLTILV